MRWVRIVGGVATLVVAGAIIGILASFLFENELFTGSEYGIAAGVSLGFVLLVLAVFATIGRPWRRWQRTTYW